MNNYLFLLALPHKYFCIATNAKSRFCAHAEIQCINAHSPKQYWVTEMRQIKISTGINSFDSENPDINIISLHQNLHYSSKKYHKCSATQAHIC